MQKFTIMIKQSLRNYTITTNTHIPRTESKRQNIKRKCKLISQTTLRKFKIIKYFSYKYFWMRLYAHIHFKRKINKVFIIFLTQSIDTKSSRTIEIYYLTGKKTYI